jgi:upstream activation factor subunit UAF30
MKPVQPDAVLGAIVGTDPLPRSEITKRLWVHIKAHGLQDATNRRQINADKAMRPLFDGKGSVTMFELPKCVSRHLIKSEG